MPENVSKSGLIIPEGVKSVEEALLGEVDTETPRETRIECVTPGSEVRYCGRWVKIKEKVEGEPDPVQTKPRMTPFGTANFVHVLTEDGRELYWIEGFFVAARVKMEETSAT